MPIVNRVADLQPDIQAWRRDIHQHPELMYDVHRTAAFVEAPPYGDCPSYLRYCLTPMQTNTFRVILH